MHQPYYKDEWTGHYLLPWTRLHALKDYYDLPAYQVDFPTIRQTFNLVPSLVLQLDDYASNRAEDVFLELSSRRASELDDAARAFLLRHFFSVNKENLLLPQRRYRELFERRSDPDSFSEGDLRDLQVWFNLGWCGPALRRHPFVAELFSKQREFTETEKQQLLDLQTEFISRIVPFYRQLAERGEIEVSTTPFYHPILPLLCSSDAARVAAPDLPLPETHFSFPDDAREQVLRSLRFCQQRLGNSPAGMWPAEGSISPAAAQIFAECGVRWIASDEDVLRASLLKSGKAAPQRRLSPAQLHRPYRYPAGGADIAIFFRDHEISDLIGFSYSRQPFDVAAADLINRLLSIRQQLDDDYPYVVSIILDGENAWEYYQDNARPFFRSLHSRLASTPELLTVTPTAYLEQHSELAALDYLHSGSWINASYRIWIGHPEKNRGWTLLARTRQIFAEQQGLLPEGDRTAAYESILRAEGSDWFWWYGDDHSSSHKPEFDLLFRNHLKAAYREMNIAQPMELDIPIGATLPAPLVRFPSRMISPAIDGRETDFFEWMGAGQVQDSVQQSAMHQVAERVAQRLLYGFNQEFLFFRVDLQRFNISLRFCFIKPLQHSLVVETTRERCHAHWESSPGQSGVAAARKTRILEVALPLSVLQVGVDENVQFYLEIFDGDNSLERWPPSGWIELPLKVQEN